MKHILVIGAGSIGKRHIRNYKSLGCKVSAVDPRRDRLDEAKEAGAQITSINMETITKLAGLDVDGAVIATPPKFHYQQVLDLIEYDIPIFLEKPGTKYLLESKAIAAQPKFNPDKLLLGYCYRWWPSIIKLREYLQNGKIGQPLSANMIISAHIEDWHPWENYKDWFLANKDLGGGALLDENHFVDLMVWFWGMPKAVKADLSTLGGFDIDVENNCEIIFIYDGFRVVMHLDMLARPHEKTISIRGTEGTLRWWTQNDYTFNRISLGVDIEGWTNFEFTFDRNDMFISEAQEFLNIIDGNIKPSCTLEDGMKVLRLVEACKESSDKGIMINV